MKKKTTIYCIKIYSNLIIIIIFVAYKIDLFLFNNKFLFQFQILQKYKNLIKVKL
jgi:hypothetical protein